MSLAEDEYIELSAKPVSACALARAPPVWSLFASRISQPRISYSDRCLTIYFSLIYSLRKSPFCIERKWCEVEENVEIQISKSLSFINYLLSDEILVNSFSCRRK